MSEARVAADDDMNRHNQSIGSFAQVATAYELVPTEFEPGTLFVGFHMTGTLSRRADGKFTFTPDTIAVNPKGFVEPRGMISDTIKNAWEGWGGFDWKKERKAIAEESRYQAHQQVMLQAEMDAACAERERRVYEEGKAKCLADPSAYGVGIVLKNGTWLSHEEAVDAAKEKPSVSHRNVAGPDEVPFLITERGVITLLEGMDEQERFVLERYLARPDVRREEPGATVTYRSYNPDGSESMTVTFPDCLMPGQEVKAARDLLDDGMEALLKSVGIPKHEFLEARWDVTVKDSKGDEQTYQFADPKFIGKDRVIETETEYIVSSNSTIEIPDESDGPAAVPIEFPNKIPESPFIGPTAAERAANRAAISIPNVKLSDLPTPLIVDPNKPPYIKTVPTREEAFFKKILPPVTITNDELDRSVPTKPEPKDYPNDPAGYVRHARLYNSMVVGTREPPIPEVEIFFIEKAVTEVQDLQQSFLAAKHQEPAVMAAIRERKKEQDALWAKFMEPRPATPLHDKLVQDLTEAGVNIGGAELDRSVPTDLPVDPTKDDPYQAFRRERHLPDTPESAEQYKAYCDLLALLSPEVAARVREELELFKHALGLHHVERVDQDEDCGAIIKESTDASGAKPA